MNKNFLTESYRDFVFIFDKDTNVYFLSNTPTTDGSNLDNIDLTNFTKKDNLESVIDTVDCFYEDVHLDEEPSNYIFIIKLKNTDGTFDSIEFDDINNAQRYIDTFKIEGSHKYIAAYFLDEDGNELDSWQTQEQLNTDIEENKSLTEDTSEDANTEQFEDSVEQPLDNGKMSDTFKELPYLDQIKQDCYVLIKTENSDNLSYISRDFDTYSLGNLKEPRYLKHGEFEAGKFNDSKLYVKITCNAKQSRIKFYFQVNILFENSNSDEHIEFEKTYNLIEFINDFDSYDWRKLFKDFSNKISKALNIISDEHKADFDDYNSFITFLGDNLDTFDEDTFIQNVNEELMSEFNITKYSNDDGDFSLIDLETDINKLIRLGGGNALKSKSFFDSVLDILRSKEFDKGLAIAYETARYLDKFILKDKDKK